MACPSVGLLLTHAHARANTHTRTQHIHHCACGVNAMSVWKLFPTIIIFINFKGLIMWDTFFFFDLGFDVRDRVCRWMKGIAQTKFTWIQNCSCITRHKHRHLCQPGCEWAFKITFKHVCSTHWNLLVVYIFLFSDLLIYIYEICVIF